MGSREVICADTNVWIGTQDNWESVITSIPDSDETGQSTSEWALWFPQMVKKIVERVRPGGYSIFYQTDRKDNGMLRDKSYLCSFGADLGGVKLMWHKICLRRDVGASDLFRPTYTHLLCYSRTNTPGKATPDVMYAGKMIYNNAMGLTACKFAVNFIKHTAQTVVDPFCGQGSILAVANKMGLDAIGVDILEDQCVKARSLKII